MRPEDSVRKGEILRASAELVRGLRKLAEDHEESLDASDPETLDYLSALHLNWLLRKHRFFWFRSVETEIYVNHTWPDIECYSPLDFELSFKHLLRLIDGDTYSLTKSSYDQGIDLIHEHEIRLDLGISACSKTIVQCKLYRGYVPVSEIRDFFGVMTANVATGLFATTGLLTSQGEQFVPVANSSPHANRLFVISSSGVTRLFQVGREITDLILDNDVDTENEIELSAWSDSLDSLRTAGRKLLWSAYDVPSQDRLF
jgi:hypothetical protein